MRGGMHLYSTLIVYASFDWNWLEIFSCVVTGSASIFYN